MESEKTSRYRLIRATRNTLDGIKVLWRNERSFRQELYLSVIVLPMIIFMNISSLLKLLLGLLLLLLLTVETLNSALEAVVDRISLETHVQSKMAKDMGSAAVGIVIVMNIIAWVYALSIHFTLLP